jgi:hypothetical protein
MLPIKLRDKVKSDNTGLVILVIIAIIISISALVAARWPRTSDNGEAGTFGRLTQIEERMDEIEAVQGWQAARMGDISERGKTR